MEIKVNGFVLFSSTVYPRMWDTYFVQFVNLSNKFYSPKVH